MGLRRQELDLFESAELAGEVHVLVCIKEMQEFSLFLNSTCEELPTLKKLQFSTEVC